jgi:hypothetical protein
VDPSVPVVRSKPSPRLLVEGPRAIHLRACRRPPALRRPNHHSRPRHRRRCLSKVQAPPRFHLHRPTIPFGCRHHRRPIRKPTEAEAQPRLLHRQATLSDSPPRWLRFQYLRRHPREMVVEGQHQFHRQITIRLHPARPFLCPSPRPKSREEEAPRPLRYQIVNCRSRPARPIPHLHLALMAVEAPRRFLRKLA